MHQHNGGERPLAARQRQRPTERPRRPLADGDLAFDDRPGRVRPGDRRQAEIEPADAQRIVENDAPVQRLAFELAAQNDRAVSAA